MYYCFLLFRRIGEYISLDLFYFVNLTSSCSLIPGVCGYKKLAWYALELPGANISRVEREQKPRRPMA